MMSDLITAPPAFEQGTDAVRDVLDRVSALVPLLRERGNATERNRSMLPENVEALEEAGAFKLTLPKARGGYEANLASIGAVLAEIARGDVSTSWVTSLINVSNWWAGILPDEVAEELFSIPNLRMSGVIAPTATALPVSGGYRVTGRWMWNTGGGISHWGGFGAMVPGDDGPTPIFALIPYSQLAVLDDFDATGMSGTGSGTTVADDVFVPTERTLAVPDLVNGNFPQRTLSSNSYFNRPTVQFFSAISSGPLVGGAWGARDVFLERLPGRSITYTNYAQQSEASLTHTQIAEATFDIETAEHFMSAANATVEDHWGAEIPLEARLRTRAYVGQVAKYSRSAVTTLFQASGATAITRALHIQRYFRDVNFLANHALVQPTSSAELLGRHLVGLEPNSTFF